MEIRAYNRNVRQSARKVRLVADLIRGLGSMQALDQLRMNSRVARTPIEKVLKSALANAEHNFHISGEDTCIKTIMVDKGTPLKRWRPRAFGRAAPIRKHSCHITLVLEELPHAKKKTVPSKRAVSESPHITSPDGLVVSQDSRSSDYETSAAPSPTPAAAEHTGKIFDTSRAGRHEFDQKNNRETKKHKGFLKKMFNRKAG